MEALEDLWRAWIRGSIDVSWLSPMKNENVRDDLKPIVVPVRQFYSTPFRSYRRRSMYEAWRRLRVIALRLGGEAEWVARGGVEGRGGRMGCSA